MAEVIPVILVLHGVHEDIDLGGVTAALPEAQRAAVPRYTHVPVRHIPYGARPIDFAAAVDTQRDWFTATLEPQLRELPSSPLAYAGLAPIPLMVHVGFLLGPWRTVTAYHPHHRSKVWTWDSDQSDDLDVVVDGIPDREIEADGEVVIRVATSYPIDSALTEAAVGAKPLATIDISTKELDPDCLRTPKRVEAVSSEFRRALDAVQEFLPNTRLIHLFASVPSALACKLGVEVQANIHPVVEVHQYDRSTNSYEPAVRLQGHQGRPQELTEEVVESAARIRALWREECERIRDFAGRLGPIPEGSHWLSALLSVPGGAGGKEVEDALPVRWRDLPNAGESDLVRASVSLEPNINGDRPDEAFGYERREAAWHLSDRFLAAVGERVTEENDLRLAAHLFLLHEELHRRVHGLTEYTARQIGSFPKAIESADYQADLWAIAHAAVFNGRQDAAFLDDAIRVATETMWAFTGRSDRLRVLEVRAFNRFLNWYWQLARIGGIGEFGRALTVLCEPPVVELSGPPLTLSRGRPAVRLEVSRDVRLDLAVWNKNQIFRAGQTPAAPLGDLVDAFSRRSGGEIVKALRGVQDSIGV